MNVRTSGRQRVDCVRVKYRLTFMTKFLMSMCISVDLKRLYAYWTLYPVLYSYMKREVSKQRELSPWPFTPAANAELIDQRTDYVMAMQHTSTCKSW